MVDHTILFQRIEKVDHMLSYGDYNNCRADANRIFKNQDNLYIRVVLNLSNHLYKVCRRQRRNKTHDDNIVLKQVY